jgi:hypothetical protein
VFLRTQPDYDYVTVSEVRNLNQKDIFHIIGVVSYLRDVKQTTRGGMCDGRGTFT